MKVKIFIDYAQIIESEINDWLSNNSYKIIDIKYAGSERLFSAMIMYDDKQEL